MIGAPVSGLEALPQALPWVSIVDILDTSGTLLTIYPHRAGWQMDRSSVTVQTLAHSRYHSHNHSWSGRAECFFCNSSRDIRLCILGFFVHRVKYIKTTILACRNLFFTSSLILIKQPQHRAVQGIAVQFLLSFLQSLIVWIFSSFANSWIC